MKRFHFIKQDVPKIKNVLTNGLGSLLAFAHSSFFKCISHLYHDLGLFFFDNKIRKHNFTQMFNSIRMNGPSINGTPGIFRCLFGAIVTQPTAKIINKPVYETSICRTYLYGSMEMWSSCFRIFGISTNNEGAFTIHNACKISFLSDCILFANICANHIISFTINSTLLVYRRLKPASTTKAGRHLIGEAIV